MRYTLINKEKLNKCQKQNSFFLALGDRLILKNFAALEAINNKIITVFER